MTFGSPQRLVLSEVEVTRRNTKEKSKIVTAKVDESESS